MYLCYLSDNGQWISIVLVSGSIKLKRNFHIETMTITDRPITNILLDC